MAESQQARPPFGSGQEDWHSESAVQLGGHMPPEPVEADVELTELDAATEELATELDATLVEATDELAMLVVVDDDCATVMEEPVPPVPPEPKSEPEPAHADAEATATVRAAKASFPYFTTSIGYAQ